jgi:hypothetical protein
VITWPRVRITFAIIGMISTAIFAWDQIGWLLSQFVVFAEWLKGMVA